MNKIVLMIEVEEVVEPGKIPFYCSGFTEIENTSGKKLDGVLVNDLLSGVYDELTGLLTTEFAEKAESEE